MMKKETNSIVWFLFILLTVVSVGCKRTAKALPDEIVFNGKLANASGKIIWLSAFDGNRMHLIDSVHVDADEAFSFRIKIKEAGFYTLFFKKNDYALLIGTKGETIMVSGDANQLSSTWNAKGSVETSRYLGYWKVSRKQLKRIDSLTILFRSSTLNPEYIATRIKLDSIFNSIMEIQRLNAIRFINKNPGSLASVLVIDARFSHIPLFYEERDINYFKLLDSGLTKSYKDNLLVDNFHKRVEQINKRIKHHQENNHLIPPGDISPSYTPNR
jgi:hypothetical protein